MRQVTKHRLGSAEEYHKKTRLHAMAFMIFFMLILLLVAILVFTGKIDIKGALSPRSLNTLAISAKCKPGSSKSMCKYTENEKIIPEAIEDDYRLMEIPGDMIRHFAEMSGSIDRPEAGQPFSIESQHSINFPDLSQLAQLCFQYTLTENRDKVALVSENNETKIECRISNRVIDPTKKGKTDKPLSIWLPPIPTTKLNATKTN